MVYDHTIIIIIIITHLFSCVTSIVESPEVWRPLNIVIIVIIIIIIIIIIIFIIIIITLAMVKPPPRRKRTPQHILVSMSLQVIRAGDLVRRLPESEHGVL